MNPFTGATAGSYAVGAQPGVAVFDGTSLWLSLNGAGTLVRWNRG